MKAFLWFLVPFAAAYNGFVLWGASLEGLRWEAVVTLAVVTLFMALAAFWWGEYLGEAREAEERRRKMVEVEWADFLGSLRTYDDENQEWYRLEWVKETK